MMMYVVLTVVVVVVAGIIALVTIMGQKRDEAWRQYASEVGGEFVKGGLFRSSEVRMRVGETVVTLDTYTVSSGDSSETYTRFRAPFNNASGLQFNIRREGLIGKLGKALGSQDIEVGDAEFDAKFLIQGKPVEDVQRLLSNMSIRQMLQEQKGMTLTARGSELHLEATGVVRDVPRLEAMYQLFRATLEGVER